MTDGVEAKEVDGNKLDSVDSRELDVTEGVSLAPSDSHYMRSPNWRTISSNKRISKQAAHNMRHITHSARIAKLLPRAM